MRLSFAVVGHVARQRDAEDLAESLGAALALDDGSRGSLANHDVAWAAFDPEADWHVVLEDDALPVENFPRHAAEALAHAPTVGAVSFYVGTVRPRPNATRRALDEANRTGTTWLSSSDVYWGPAVALPVELIRPMLAHVQTVDTLGYDRRLGNYLQAVGLPCHYTVPSLVDHADNHSLLRPEGPGRRAYRVGVPGSWTERGVWF